MDLEVLWYQELSWSTHGWYQSPYECVCYCLIRLGMSISLSDHEGIEGLFSYQQLSYIDIHWNVNCVERRRKQTNQFISVKKNDWRISKKLDDSFMKYSFPFLSFFRNIVTIRRNILWPPSLVLCLFYCGLYCLDLLWHIQSYPLILFILFIYVLFSLYSY